MSGLVEASKSGAALAHGVSLREALRVWTRVALLSFGGPAGQIAVMHRIIVDEKHWVSEERFLHALNYCMLLPGPEATQLATYVGWLMHRTLGGVMAGVLFVTPGIIALMGLSYVYAAYGNVPVIIALFFGLKAAVLAIVLEALSRISKRALKNPLMFALAALAFIAIFFLGVPFPIIIIAAALIGFVLNGSTWPNSIMPRRTRPPVQARRRLFPACSVKNLLRTRSPRLDAYCRWPQHGLRSGSPLSLHCSPRAKAPMCSPRLASSSQNGCGHIRRRLCGSGLCGAAGGRNPWLAQARQNARRSRYGGDDARPADHGCSCCNRCSPAHSEDCW
jgi:chromate transport protein ChrA